ncbi:MFS transporter [Sediminitomix flava]|uniref:UMF1 family MFS transporter n=1 Tax=Sediminitomix flava TaxID=379075 RepID=A0A315ZI06_SEDFL|nr:MFS transporter [Sediminitomix flava]PWJ44849.1 UMF1 family MFS transporter [Sediminitomix flava]
MEKNKPKVLQAWCVYDWANSVYALTISSAIFPIYFNQSTRSAFGGDIVNFLGFQIKNTVLYSYTLSAAFLLVALILPFLSGIADYGHIKKRMMKFFTYLGSLSCIGLFFFTGENIELGIMLSILGAVGYAGGIVFYNAFLPEIATKDRFDLLSARGFSYGYIGGVIQLIISLILVTKPDWFGLEQGSLPARISFLTVGLWWLIFAQYTFAFLPENVSQAFQNDKTKLLKKGYVELSKVFQSLKKYRAMKNFLLAFFFYNMGVQTVMYLAATFGEAEIKLAEEKLIATILILQLVAIPGAYFFAYFSKKFGNKISLISMVLIWIGICISAFYTYTEYEFYALASMVGVVMGGIQSLSRSTFSKLIPEGSEDPASYFSFYDVTDKLAIVIGTFAFGFIEQITQSMRYSALALGLFFIFGLLYLIRFRIPSESKVENQQYSN